jgi:hypothetical protein
VGNMNGIEFWKAGNVDRKIILKIFAKQDVKTRAVSSSGFWHPVTFRSHILPQFSGHKPQEWLRIRLCTKH